MSERILVIGAHPDDLEFGSSGTMIKWAKEGKKIYYLVCTKGDKGGTRNDLTPEELVEVRREEQRNAAKTIGVTDVVFLDYGDGELEHNKELKEDLVRVIREVRPQKIFTFDPGNQNFDGFYRWHSDHRVIAIAVFDAVYPASKNRLYFPHLIEEGLEPHMVNECWFFGTDRPNEWIDVTDSMDRKIEALRCHPSQFGDYFTKAEKMIREWAREAAKDKDYTYAEAFRRIAFPIR